MGKQTPIRYVSRTLHEAERNYAPLEKLPLCLLHLSRRLHRYFEAHPIRVITDQPIKQTLNKPEVSGKLAKYAVELGAYNIAYVPQNAVKGTKNEAEYEAFLAYLRIARKMKEQAPKAKVDLKLVACQMNGEFVASSEEMAKYLTKAKERATLFKRFSIENIPRNQNQKADVLSNMRSCILTRHGLEAATVRKPASIVAVAVLVTGASQSRQHSSVTTWDDLVEKFVQKFYQLSDHNEEIEEDYDPEDITDIFKIEGNLYDFETPLCEAFNNFNYLLKIDKDLFTFDIQGTGTYEEYELNNHVTRDLEEQWLPGMAGLEKMTVFPRCKVDLALRKIDDMNQGLNPAGKPLQPSDSGPLRSADNEKELWDSRMHQTRKETGGEGMPKVLGLRRLKQGKGGHQPSTNIGENLPPNGPFVDFAGSVTPFVRWIEDYPLSNGLKMPSHIGSYDGKGNPDNFFHLFEGRLFLKWSKQRSWENNRGHKNREWVRFSPYRDQSRFALSPSKSPKEILAMEKAARSFEPPPKMFESKRSQDTSKYCHFHEDYGHDTNDCRHLKTQIQEAVNSGQLSHLMKGIKKERTKSFDTIRGESKKDKGIAPAEAPILMVSREAHIAKSLTQENTDCEGKEIIFPPIEKVNNAPVIIEAKIFGRKVGRVYMDSGSSYKIIYEHYFEKLNPTIKATRMDLKTPLVGFSGERSWSVSELLLEITIGDASLSRIETLNFVIIRYDSSHNILLGRTSMQRMGIIVSTIHGAIKFHTKKGIKTVFLIDEADEGAKRAKKIPATNKERILSCVNAEEKIIINDKYPDQTVTIGRHKQGMSQRRLPSTRDRLENRIPLRVPTEVFPRRLQGLPSNLNGRRRRRQNKLLRVGLMLIDPEGKEYTYALRFMFETTNNEAEYEAFLAGLRIAQEIEIAKVAIFLDFQLLVNQIKGTFVAKQALIKDYLQKVKTVLRGFEDYTVDHVRRNQNKKADALSKLASMTFKHLTKEVLVEVLTKRSIEEKEVLKVDTQERKSWMDPIHEYVLSGLLPEDTKDARKIRIQAPQYKLI
ncbi:reverse transcriptase domain-containing protein [Tanacetum coccineum]